MSVLLSVPFDDGLLFPFFASAVGKPRNIGYVAMERCRIRANKEKQ